MKITDLIHCLRQENGSSYAAGLMQQAADLIEQQAAELQRLRAENQALHNEAEQARHDRGLMKRQLDRAEYDNERLRAVASAVPTSWLHPLLTGPKAVPGLDRCDGRVIEKLLRRVRDKVQSAIDAARGE